MWQPRQSVRKSFEVVLTGLAASNQDQPQPSPHNLLAGWLFLLSFTITNQPFNFCAWLTVPVVIAPVVASNTSFTSTEPSGETPIFAICSDRVRRGINDMDLLR